MRFDYNIISRDYNIAGFQKSVILKIKVPEGISGELFHLDLQIALLNPAFWRRRHISAIRHFRQPSAGLPQEQTPPHCSASFSASLVIFRILDSKELVLQIVDCNNEIADID